jgi:hypothetical protein
MPFLSVNGWSVPVASVQRPEREVIGARGRAQSGVMRRGDRAQALILEAETPVMAAADANALEAMCLGRGFAFSLNDGLYSQRTSLGPVAGYNAALHTTSPTPKFGARYLKVNSSGGACAWAFNLEETNVWSAMWWHNHNNSPSNTWAHYCVVNNAGQWSVYVDGSLTYGPSGTPPTSPGNFSASVSGNLLTFSLLGKQVNGTNSANANFDDLVLLPWAVPAGLVAAVVASTRAFPAPPFVEVSGDVVDGRVVLCAAEVTAQAVERAVIGGTWTNTLRSLSIRFEEVNPF